MINFGIDTFFRYNLRYMMSNIDKRKVWANQKRLLLVRINLQNEPLWQMDCQYLKLI